MDSPLYAQNYTMFYYKQCLETAHVCFKLTGNLEDKGEDMMIILKRIFTYHTFYVRFYQQKCEWEMWKEVEASGLP